MSNEKVVVILLLVTIILSIVSVVMTFSVGEEKDLVAKEVRNIVEGSGSGEVGFEIVPSGAEGT